MTYELLGHFALLPFAALAVENTWFRGSLFEGLRRELELRAIGDAPDLSDVLKDAPQVEVVEEPQAAWWVPWVHRLPRLLAQLLSCPFCLRRHIAVWLSLLLVPVALDAPQLVAEAGCWVVRLLAVVWLADTIADYLSRERT